MAQNLRLCCEEVRPGSSIGSQHFGSLADVPPRLASKPASRRARLRSKRPALRAWCGSATTAAACPARRPLRPAPGTRPRSQVLDVVDHLGVVAASSCEVVALVQAVAEHVLVDRGDDVELVGERRRRATRPPAATGRSGARCSGRSAGSSVMSRIHGWRCSASRVRSAISVDRRRASRRAVARRRERRPRPSPRRRPA